MSTHGYEAEPSEVDAVWEALVGDREPHEDDMPRWVHLESRAALLAAVATRIADERSRIARSWSEAGDSYATIAARVGVSRGRAQQFVERGRSSR